VAASTVRATIKRFQAAGLSWPVAEDMTHAALEARLFSDAGTKQGHRRQVEPDWPTIHCELKRKHVTLAILWDEYIARDPEGYRYSRFCELYRIWANRRIRPRATRLNLRNNLPELGASPAAETIRVRAALQGVATPAKILIFATST
jgi:transposase